MTRIGFAYNQKPESTSASPTSATADSGIDDIYAEWDSPATIQAVAHALSAFGHVIHLEADADFPARLRDARPDIVFNIAEGLHGPNREAHVPAICEYLGFPYSASDPFTLSLCLHKARTKQMLAAHGVATPPFFLVADMAQLQHAARGNTHALEYPLFLKPVQEGSSKGITQRNFVRNAAELLARGAELLELYRQPVLVEAYLPGAEFTCGVLGNGASARMLPPVAMRFDTLPKGAVPVYGFEAKWIWDTPDRALEIFECPARIPDTLHAAVQRVALGAYHALGCRDWARIDVRLDADGQPQVIEVNPLPGILPDPAENSCLPKAARADGLSYDQLIQACLIHAAQRQGVPLQLRSAA